jgi:hypothetical protein
MFIREVGNAWNIADTTFESGDILLLKSNSVTKHTLKFTFDTFYVDAGSIGVVA